MQSFQIMDQSWFSKDYGVSFTFLLRMLSIADCIHFCILCGILLIEILLIEFLGTLLVPILKVNENNDRWGKVRTEIFEVTFLKGTPFPSNLGYVYVHSFSCHLREMKMNPWNIRQKMETNTNKEAEITKGNKRNIQELDTRNGK